MRNRTTPPLTKVFNKLKTLIAVAPESGQRMRFSLEDIRQREIQLELDFRPPARRPFVILD